VVVEVPVRENGVEVVMIEPVAPPQTTICGPKALSFLQY